MVPIISNSAKKRRNRGSLLRKIQSALESWKRREDRKPLLLQGARQVGKTYALKAFGKASFARTFYLNFEDSPDLATLFEPDLKPMRILQEIGLRFEASVDIEHDLVIFDEIQAAPKALTSLKYFAENLPVMAVCAAGSLLGVHLGEASYPVGKVDMLNLHPLTFEEFLGGIGEGRYAGFLSEFDFSEPIPTIIHSHLWEMLKYYLVVGGLPEVVSVYAAKKEDAFAAITAVRDRQFLLTKAYSADIAKYAGKVNALHIDRIFQSVPEKLANEVDGSSSKYTFKGVVPGVNGYTRLVGAFDWLKAAGLVHKLPIAKKAWIPLTTFAEESVFKLYAFDVGILGSLGGLAPKAILDYGFGSYQGYLMENFVLQEMVATSREHIVAWKEGTAEVEFLIAPDGKIVPLEVKSGWVTQAKSLKVFAEKYRPEQRVTLSAKNFSRNRETGTYQVPLYLAGRLRQMLALP